MKQFLRKHILMVSFLILGGIVGLIIYMSKPPIAIWYVIYRYEVADIDAMKQEALVDTLFLFEDVLLRNYTGSFTAEVQYTGYMRQELKVYASPEQSKHEVTIFAVRALGSGSISVYDTILKEKQRKKRIILDMLLLGFFLGIAVEFGQKTFRSRRQKGLIGQ